jgi:glycosyltransferase involved in cell wall biosynthesis
LIVSHADHQFNLTHDLGPSLHYHRLSFDKTDWLARANALCEEFKPDGTLAVMFNSGLRTTRLKRRQPLWIDLYGDRLIENQLALYMRGNDRGFRTTLQYQNIVLQGGDAYSVCSTPQKFALVGQLSMAGRLNRHTLGYDFAHVVLPGAPSKQEEGGDGLKLRGEVFSNDSFVVLWCGGYNVWTDVDTLFQAVSQAMDRDPRVVYVSAGAAVRLAQNTSYDRLLKMIAVSPHRDRFHMLGWQPSKILPGLYRQADVGINLDAFHYETLLGTRTRLVEMMHYGLPVITTLGCELSYIVENQGLGLTFPIGDENMFRDHILALANNGARQKMLSEQVLRYTSQELSFKNTTRPMREWAHRPYFAPDRFNNKPRFDIRDAEFFLRSVARSILWKVWALERGE